MGNNRDDKAAQRAEAQARWAAAQADIARHDAEFEANNPNWEQEHGGGR